SAAARLEELEAENNQLRKDLDCGCGISGCKNMARMCRHCIVAENERLRECLPSPDMMSGWDDPGAPDDVLVEIGAVCSLRGVEMPDHVREAWRRRGETD